MFKTKYDEREKVITESGSGFSPIFSLKSKEAGVIDLEITGEKDLYQEIQSHAESVDIKNILLRYELGDTSALEKRQGQYIDITDLPTNFADIMKTVITAENQFNELPLEIRKEYNFSPSEYIADIGSEKWLGLLGLKTEKEEPVEKKEPVKEKTLEEVKASE